MGHKINLPIDGIMEGAFTEKLQHELEQVFENIHDPNTPAQAKRTVQATLTFAPDDEREIIGLEVKFKTTLAPQEGIGTKVITGVDMRTGSIEATEFKSNQPGQFYMDDEGRLRSDKNELVEDIEKVTHIDQAKGGQ